MLSTDSMITILFWFFLGPTILGIVVILVAMPIIGAGHIVTWIRSTLKPPN